MYKGPFTSNESWSKSKHFLWCWSVIFCSFFDPFRFCSVLRGPYIREWNFTYWRRCGDCFDRPSELDNLDEVCRQSIPTLRSHCISAALTWAENITVYISLFTKNIGTWTSCTWSDAAFIVKQYKHHHTNSALVCKSGLTFSLSEYSTLILCRAKQEVKFMYASGVTQYMLNDVLGNLGAYINGYPICVCPLCVMEYRAPIRMLHWCNILILHHFPIHIRDMNTDGIPICVHPWVAQYVI